MVQQSAGELVVRWESCWETAGVEGMSAATGEAVASAYGLGAVTGAPVYADRGEQGRIWRLETRGGAWAVKELLLPVAEADAVMDVRFQLAPRLPGYRCRSRGQRGTGG